jgi:hypothetical protein
MLFHDRELDADGTRRVRLGRLVDPGVSARLDALGALSDAVRSWAVQTGVNAVEERRRAARTRARRRALAACASVTLSVALAPWLFSLAARGTAAGRAEEDRSRVESARVLPARASEAVAVETVDFGARAGTIFSVPGGTASETTVVWLPDDTEGTPNDSL